MRLIDGDALQEKLTKKKKPGPANARYTEGFNDALLRFKSMIHTAPTIEPQRTGRWIHDGYAFKGGIDWMHCSECGHKDSWSVATRTPFCGWCGARMEGNDESD